MAPTPFLAADKRASTEPRRRRHRPIEPLSREALVEVDRELARSARSAGALRLRIGECLEVLDARSWHHQLGFSGMTAYALERAGQPGHWAKESRRVARKLADLPVLRAALVSGALGWSMVELLARHATPENEVGLVAEASRSTVRKMRASLDCAQRATDAESESEGRASITFTMSSFDAWLFEHTRWLFDRVEPHSSTDDFVHGLLVEGLTSLMELVPRGEMAELRERTLGLRERAVAWRAQCRAWREEAEARVEAGLDRAASCGLEAERAWELAPDAYPGAKALDTHVRELCQELAARDLLFGALAERFWHSDGWRRLGYASEEQYARERLGVSLSSIRTKRALARRSERMPSVAEAIERRSIGFEAALLVTRVATEATAGAWLERAAERTFKLLRQEVEAAELAIRMGGPRDQLPPDQAALDAIARRRRAASTAIAESDGKLAFAPRTRSVLQQMSDGPGSRPGHGLARVRQRLNVTVSTRDLWCDFEEYFHAARGWLPPGVTPIRLLCVAFCIEWGHMLGREAAYGHIYARDGYECRSPLCTRRDVTPNHLVFRSRGGGDEDENLISLCTWCHLFGVHGGLIQVEPPASEPRWVLGRDAISIVEGRRKFDVNEHAMAA